MAKSDTVGKLAEALAQAQGKIRCALRDSENPFFKTRYASVIRSGHVEYLSAAWANNTAAAVRPAC